MADAIHPHDALTGGTALPSLPPCEHFAGNERQMRKALELQQRLGPVFDLTCDCEDGAPVGSEAAHVEMIAGLVASADNRFGRVGVRVHDPDHPSWSHDIDVLLSRAGERLAYLTIPKVASAARAEAAIGYVGSRILHFGLRRAIPVHVLMETHGAMHDAWSIAALPWVETLDFGLLDFVSSHGGALDESAMRSPGQFEHRLIIRAKADLAAAALAHGIVPCHAICMDTGDPEAAYRDASRARREYGFLRMVSIHPNQIEPIVRAMTPELSLIGRSADILLAGQAAGWGPIKHDGQMHDRASYRHFWQVLQRARACGAGLPPAAEAAFFGNQRSTG